MAQEESSWLSRVLAAFSSLFTQKDAGQKKTASTPPSRKSRHIAGHWPVYIELCNSTRETHKPGDDSVFTLRFSASDAPLLKSLKIQAREFNGSYVPEKKAFIVQVPERLVQELTRNADEACHVEGFVDGASVGSRRFNIPLSF
ncbi:hypothetical protein [Chitinimonas sp.]|uniref:hypothetical protein n=1 Tax=Chitinimonas sp. TaxID=1934313 RepID=UPI0035B31415